jgi:hypothetical protein
MKLDQVTIEVEYRGHQYRVTGTYFSGYLGSHEQPPEPAKFEIDDFVHAYGVPIIETDEALNELADICLKVYEELLAKDEAEAKERVFLTMKERDFV